MWLSVKITAGLQELIKSVATAISFSGAGECGIFC
jgi:hypothetical protein